MYNIQTYHVGGGLTPEARLWRQRVIAAGGSLAPGSLQIANNFARALRATSYYTKIQWLLPMLGVGINAARVPLIDRLNVGAAVNNNCIDSDYSQSTGLLGSGAIGASTRSFDTLLKASDLSPLNNAGFGYWARAINGGGWSLASRPVQGLYGFYLEETPAHEIFYYGNGDGSQVELTVTAGNSDYYCQRASTTSRIIYQDGSSIGGTSVSTTDSGSNGANIFLQAIDNTGTIATNAQCSLAYLTDGSLTAGEISALHSLLQTYLIGPTGK